MNLDKKLIKLIWFRPTS